MVEKETESVLSNYISVKNIGDGIFGKVKLIIDKKTKKNYALKVINKQKLKKVIKNHKYYEIEALSKFSHPNIIYTHQILHDEKNHYIIMEYCENGELFEIITKKGKLTEKTSSKFFYQLINGVSYIHSQNYSHRDLKPENLLLTKNNIIKIIDFGLCCPFSLKSDLLKSKCGSPSYTAPEIVRGEKYNAFKTDIWSCGIILYVMLCGSLPFIGENEEILFENIMKCKFDIPFFISKNAKKLLKGILNSDPEKRFTIEDIKNSEFYLNGQKLIEKKRLKEENENIWHKHSTINDNKKFAPIFPKNNTNLDKRTIDFFHKNFLEDVNINRDKDLIDSKLSKGYKRNKEIAKKHSSIYFNSITELKKVYINEDYFKNKKEKIIELNNFNNTGMRVHINQEKFKQKFKKLFETTKNKDTFQKTNSSQEKTKVINNYNNAKNIKIDKNINNLAHKFASFDNINKKNTKNDKKQLILNTSMTKEKSGDKINSTEPLKYLASSNYKNFKFHSIKTSAIDNYEKCFTNKTSKINYNLYLTNMDKFSIKSRMSCGKNNNILHKCLKEYQRKKNYSKGSISNLPILKKLING